MRLLYLPTLKHHAQHALDSVVDGLKTACRSSNPDLVFAQTLSCAHDPIKYGQFFPYLTEFKSEIVLQPFLTRHALLSPSSSSDCRNPDHSPMRSDQRAFGFARES